MRSESDNSNENSLNSTFKHKEQAEKSPSFSAIWPFLRAAWAEIGLASFYLNAGQLLLPLFAMLVYDKIAQNGLFETLWALVFGMAIYLSTDAGMRLIRSWSAERISAQLAQRSDEHLWEKLVNQPNRLTGGYAHFLSNYRDLTLSRDFISSSYLLALVDLPFLILFLTVIGVIAWQLLIVALVLVLIFSSAGTFLHVRLAKLSRTAEEKNTQRLSFLGEALYSFDLVQGSPGSEIFKRTWHNQAENATCAERNKRIAAQHLALLSTTIQIVSTVAILTTGVYLVHARMLSIGQLIAGNILVGRAMAMVGSLFVVISKWQDFKRSAQQMDSCLRGFGERTLTPKPEVRGEMNLLQLTKKYQGRPPALEGVTCRIQPGERIALLGRPGSGKSTLLQLLCGVCSPESGQVLVDGLDLADIARSDRARWLAYKSQEPIVFAGTLEENLRISGCEDQQRYQRAIWAAGLEEEFKSGRMSLGMQIAEQGSNLSGGQRQKVALARALAQLSSILLLDEPTLGLDPESERSLAKRLPQLLDQDAVLLMSTHSPVMLGMTQRILVLEGGKLVADGPREKLVTLNASKEKPVSQSPMAAS